MINRKIAGLALLAAVTAPVAFAADIDPTDGRAGGAFWGRPITPSATVERLPRPALVIGEVNPSDGRAGGAFWGSPTAVPQHVAATTDERFVATSRTRTVRPFSLLEEYNP